MDQQPPDAVIAAYVAQLPTDQVQALAAADPWAVQQAVAALQPPSLLEGHRGGILLWRFTGARAFTPRRRG